MVKLYFKEYLPDLPDFENPGATVANNVIPGNAAYEPFPSLTVTSSNAMDAFCRGAVNGKDADGNTFNFFGNASKLYRLLNGAMSDVSKTGGYNTASDSYWEFAKFGQRMLATNFDDAIQSYTLGSSLLFADLAASAPKARTICTTPDFVMVGATNDVSDGSVPYRARWCAFRDPTDWTVSASTLADYNDFDSSNGWIQRLIGGTDVTVFQENAISRMGFVGSPYVFQVVEIESGRGLLIPKLCMKIGNIVPFCGQDGFYIFDGNQSVPIGEGKVNKTFFADLDQSYLYRCSIAADVNKQVIYFSYPGSGNTSGRANKILAYNYSPSATLRWASADVEVEQLVVTYAEGYTLETLDNYNSNLDAITISLDSRYWTGNTANLSAINSDHKLAQFTGTALTATLETGEAQMFEGSRALVKLLRSMVDGSGTVTMQVGTRNKLSESVTWGSSLSEDSMGNFQTFANARYHRARVSIASGFNFAQGVEVLDASNEGFA